ncbi:MAG: ABC transporter permease [Acidimicrobiales bacterium]|nr:ABC transporter permease [Acidimicrobiales bacterium]
MTTISDLRSSRELYVNLTLRELRSKYKRSVLGWFWSLLNPLAIMGIFSLVFQFFLKVPVPVGDPSGLQFFAFFLLCGLLPYNFVSASLTGGMSALVANGNLVKKVWFPRELLVAANTTSSGVGLLIELGVLLVALLVVGNMVLPWIPVALVIVVLQVVFVLGLALVLSVLNVYFRDLEHLVGIALQVWFYATPIIYPPSLVEEQLSASFSADNADLLYTIYRLNPMNRFVEAYRSVFYDLTFPSAGTMVYLVVVAGASLALGRWVFRKFEGRLAEEL